MFSDSHCHLRDLTGNPVAQAVEAGVELVLNTGIDLTSSRQAVLTARDYRVVKACVGIHPWRADLFSEEVYQGLRELAADPEVVAISEIGLDYVGRRTLQGDFVNEYVPKKTQVETFSRQLQLAKELGLPVLVHDRTPDQEVLDIVENEGNVEVGVAIHGFSKKLEYARRCVDIGVYISIGSRPLESGRQEFIQIVRETPVEWILTETDSNSPVGVVSVAERIAEINNLTRDEVGLTTTKNLKRLVNL